MANLRLFIAGHINGLSEPERAEEREKLTIQAEFFENIGFNVVNPVELLDCKSFNPQQVTRKYIKMMMDCTHILLFPDFVQHEECRIASMVASSCGMYEIHLDAKSRVELHDQNVIKVASAIYTQTQCRLKDYANDKRMAKLERIRALFAQNCFKMGVPFQEIASWLNIKSSKKNQEIQRKLSAYNKYYDDRTELEFRENDREIKKLISQQ